MKSTGIVRKLDSLGRIVIPAELRKTLNIKIKDPIEIYVSGDSIVFRKYLPACIFCGEEEEEEMKTYKNKYVCKNCIKLLNRKR